MASPPPSRRVLLVEPWFAGSHRAWAEGLRQHSRHRIDVLAEEPTGWRRTFAAAAGRLADRVDATPDVVLASSMMDLTAFRRRAGLTGVPTILYMHENQLTYDRSQPDPARGAVNWAAVRGADTVVFNSRFHRNDFHDALGLLGVAADEIARSHREARVLPVGIDADALAAPRASGDGPPIVAWNHRWEADKDPAAFIAALAENADLPFRLILLGGGSGRDRFTGDLAARFGDRIHHSGHADRRSYLAVLGAADVVVSAARQEFFGVSIAEAMAAGAVPLVPDGLAYPELLGPGLEKCRYPPGGLAAALRTLLADPVRIARLSPHARRAGRRFDWKTVVPGYDELIDSMV